MSFFTETVLSVAIMVPLGTLCLRLFRDSMQFSNVVKEKLLRLDWIQKLELELLLHQQQYPYISFFKDSSTFHFNNSTKQFFVQRKDTKQMIEICQYILSLKKGAFFANEMDRVEFTKQQASLFSSEQNFFVTHFEKPLLNVSNESLPLSSSSNTSAPLPELNYLALETSPNEFVNLYF